MGCATSTEARRDMVWVGADARTRRSFSLPSVDRQRLRLRVVSMLGTLGLAGGAHHSGLCRHATLSVEEMKSYNDHAAENETPRQQLREDADACDMPMSPATGDMPELSGLVRARIIAFQEKIKWTRIKARDAKLSPLWPPGGKRKAVEYLTSLRDVRKSARRSCTSRGSAGGGGRKQRLAAKEIAGRRTPLGKPYPREVASA